MSIEYLLLVLHQHRTALIKHFDHDSALGRTSGKIKKSIFAIFRSHRWNARKKARGRENEIKFLS